MALFRGPVKRHRRKLTLRHAVLPIRAAQLVLQGFDSVQPVLDVIAVHDDARRIPLIENPESLLQGKHVAPRIGCYPPRRTAYSHGGD